MKTLVLNTLEEIARRALDLAQGPRIAVSGGSTYAAVFKLWVPEIQRRVQSGQSQRFFPVDERAVPFEDPDNNWRVCYESLLSPVGLGDQKKHLAVSASQFQGLLDIEFDGPVIFDQIFLGMGEDGHTASLFPGGNYLKNRKSVTLDVVGPKPPPNRITLGLKPLWECKRLIAIVLGASKAPMVKRLREGDMSLPITMALAGNDDSILILDRAAAES